MGFKERRLHILEVFSRKRCRDKTSCKVRRILKAIISSSSRSLKGIFLITPLKCQRWSLNKWLRALPVREELKWTLSGSKLMKFCTFKLPPSHPKLLQHKPNNLALLLRGPMVRMKTLRTTNFLWSKKVSVKLNHHSTLRRESITNMQLLTLTDFLSSQPTQTCLWRRKV
jgi:hypothetical protein